ncbi:hypothetical protein ATANTOWER_016095 [Ataeniobius toweri]|uniref:Uncharacterized protein n=1 Tax=Ataeniobius toweri TaxID=208326 RepID=A0ABU7AK83_9TELE|nr:hypothetical protein [Ataeniobius toweri]
MVINFTKKLARAKTLTSKLPEVSCLVLGCGCKLPPPVHLGNIKPKVLASVSTCCWAGRGSLVGVESSSSG